MIGFALLLLALIISGFMAVLMWTGDGEFAVGALVFLSIFCVVVFVFSYNHVVDQIEGLEFYGVDARMGVWGCEVVGYPGVSCWEVLNRLHEESVIAVVDRSGGVC